MQYELSGLVVYFSEIKLINNNVIENGECGIKLFNNSNVSIKGNSDAVYVDQTQRIMDNAGYEIYTDGGSFPHFIKWNAIIDDIGPSQFDYLLYGDFQAPVKKDITNNFWGNNFDPANDLFPWQYYKWNPIFNLIYEEEDISDEEMLFNTAEEKFDQKNYSGAQADFKYLVEQYPESIYAIASLKRLFSLEQYFTNDYYMLKEYYLTNDSIITDSSLTKTGDFLANQCNVKLENWEDAIAWYENRILEPPSFADSIYSIIDLGNIYFLMENGQKSSYVGNMPQYKPVSVEQFEEDRDYLLSLLPGDKLSETMKESINALKTGELLQNVPNPFNNTTQIWYKLEDEASVSLSVYDYTGKKVSAINPGKQDKGSHFMEFSSEGLPSGIYFYTLEVNGKLSDSKKMTVMR
jgi:tetratricopeptide (TPR) repeat protein